MSPHIDLSCDLGERDDAAGIVIDEALLGIVTSANIACGGHAGDEASMGRVVDAAMRRGVAMGAHPGYPERSNFGRAGMVLSFGQIRDTVETQVHALSRIAARLGGRVVHVKPHGALYHDAMLRDDVARAVADGVGRVDRTLRLVGLAGARALHVWREMGMRVVSEAFADRRYEADGSLRQRVVADALIVDIRAAADQALRIATRRVIATTGNTEISLIADTVCIHSDTDGAVQRALAIRDALKAAGVSLRGVDV